MRIALHSSEASQLNVGMRREKGSGPKSAKHPKGRSGFWHLTPFPNPQEASMRKVDIEAKNDYNGGGFVPPSAFAELARP